MSRKIFLDSVEPMFKNPITDIFNHIVDCQTYGPCADLELAMYDCVEAYGMGKRGAEKCSDLVDDYRECINKSKQRKRYLRMRIERERQYYFGERSKENHFSTAPIMTSY